MSGRADLDELEDAASYMDGSGVHIGDLDRCQWAQHIRFAASELAEHRRGADEPRGPARSPVDVPVDLGHLRTQANAMLCGHPITLTDFIRIGRDILSAAAELDLWRRPRIPADTTRLDACRDRASRLIAGMLAATTTEAVPRKVAAEAEDLAHALLAAEREPGK